MDKFLLITAIVANVVLVFVTIGDIVIYSKVIKKIKSLEKELGSNKAGIIEAFTKLNKTNFTLNNLIEKVITPMNEISQQNTKDISNLNKSINYLSRQNRRKDKKTK